MRMFRDRHSARSRAFQVFANGLDTDVGAIVDLPDAIAPLGLRRSRSLLSRLSCFRRASDNGTRGIRAAHGEHRCRRGTP